MTEQDTALRARAKARLQEIGAEPARERDPRELAHELDVHRVELEIQNEELRAAEIDLVAERDRLRDLYQLAPVGYLTIDERGVVTESNRMAAELLGCDLGALVSRPLAAFVLPDDAIEFERLRRRLLVSSGRQTTVLRSQSGQGVRHLRIDAIPSLTRDRGPRRFLTALIDVSEQRAAEAELRDRDRRLRAVFDTAIDGIVNIDSGGLIDSANRTAAEMFRCAPETLLGQPLSGLVVEPQRRALVRWLARPPADGKGAAARRELLGRRADGTTFPLELGLGGGAGEPVTLVLRDLTDRKVLEEQLVQAQKMEAIGRLASGVAHDFNNLLMGIAGGTDVALSRLDPASPARELLEEIKHEALGGAGIVSELLGFARKSDGAAEAVVIDERIAATESMLRRLLGEDLHVELQLGARGAVVPMSESRLQQILINLGTNARDAMPRGGALTISTEQGPGAAGEGEVVTVRITDTGAGMDEQTRELIFEPFYTTKQVGQGTGLGLYSVFSMVREAGGRIDVESAPGQGTSIVIELPMTARAPAGVAEPEPEQIPQGRGETVLVVEDEPTVRRAVLHYLRGAGYRVVAAASCQEGLSVFGRNRGGFDLVLSDVVLPDGTGPEVVSAVNESSPGTASLFMSAHPATLLQRTGRLAEGDIPLQKPFSKGRLLAAVRAALDGRAVRPRSAKAGITILVVEDHESTREAELELLRGEGYQVISAGGVEEAVAAAGTVEKIDLMLCDLRLPDGSGPELVNRLAIPAVIFVSGLSAGSDEVRGATSGGRARFLAKPVDLHQLLAEIEDMVTEHG
jgi:two-component system, cell cycle sensor histidine kinase and response regulator CckA